MPKISASSSQWGFFIENRLANQPILGRLTDYALASGMEAAAPGLLKQIRTDGNIYVSFKTRYCMFFEAIRHGCCLTGSMWHRRHPIPIQ